MSAVISDMRSDIKIVHGLSQGVTYTLLSHISKALEEAPSAMQKLVLQLENKTRELQLVEAQLQKAPEDDVLSPLMQELGTLNQEVGMWNKKAIFKTRS